MHSLGVERYHSFTTWETEVGGLFDPELSICIQVMRLPRSRDSRLPKEGWLSERSETEQVRTCPSMRQDKTYFAVIPTGWETEAED